MYDTYLLTFQKSIALLISINSEQKCIVNLTIRCWQQSTSRYSTGCIAWRDSSSAMRWSTWEQHAWMVQSSRASPL